MKNKTPWFAAILAIAACLLVAACNGADPLDASAVLPAVGAPTPNGGGPLKPTLAAPILSVAGATQTTITLQLCAPDSQPGVPAGFSLQWTDYATYTALGGFPDPACDGSFAGEANPEFVLAPKQCVLIEVGNLSANVRGVSFTCNTLTCGTEYVFRAFSHANESYKRSPFTAPLYAWTAPCYEGCTYTQGYWKNHSSDWPVS
jgi:hypothetical protein